MRHLFLCWKHWSVRLQLAARGQNMLKYVTTQTWQTGNGPHCLCCSRLKIGIFASTCQNDWVSVLLWGLGAARTTLRATETVSHPHLQESHHVSHISKLHYLIPGPEKIQWHRTLLSTHCALERLEMAPVALSNSKLDLFSLRKTSKTLAGVFNLFEIFIIDFSMGALCLKTIMTDFAL